MTIPVLSICVPSRNRQKYFKELIDYLLSSKRDDVEFVLADNSDDPTIMNTFMAERPDARVKYLPSENRVLSMPDNWERTLQATTGDWISVIGDDDLIDPDLIDTLKIAIALKPGLEGFSWTNLKYSWIGPDTKPANVAVPLSTRFYDVPQSLLMRRAYRWDDATTTVTCGFSVYHSAISRNLINRVKERFGGRFFEHPTVDYDNALKNAYLGRNFVMCARPFSIFGACPESNSAALRNIAGLKASVDNFMADLGRDFNQDKWVVGFPFHATLGLPTAVALVQQFLRHTHDIGLSGWEGNFAEACARYCNGFHDRSEFDAIVDMHRRAFRKWKGGAYLSRFKPKFEPARDGLPFIGLQDTTLYVSDRLAGATSPVSFYEAVNGLLEKPSEIAAELYSFGAQPKLLTRLEAEAKAA